MKKHFLILCFLLSLGSLAQVPIMNAINGASAVCSSPAAASSFSTSASNSPTSYSWSVISGTPGAVISNPTNSVTSVSFPYSSGTYTLYCYATNGFGSSPTTSFVVTVFETPSVTFSGNNYFCQGSSTFLQASSTILMASPTISYFWSPGAGLNTQFGSYVQAFPNTTTTYTVLATKGMCSNTAAITVSVLPNPGVSATISFTNICLGNTVILSGTGANSYSWTNGVINGIPFTPSVSAGYIVTGTNLNGCSDTAFAQVNVTQANFTVSPASATICQGAALNVSLTGGLSYSLNNTPTSPAFSVSPGTTTTYTITGANGPCTSVKTLYVYVDLCIGLRETRISDEMLLAYPNPSGGSLFIRSLRKEEADLLNSAGHRIRTIYLSTDNVQAVEGLLPGLYFLVSPSAKLKIIVR